MPASDIQNTCTELFSPNATINATESMSGQFCSRPAGDDYFHIGTPSNAERFVPHVDDITEDNDDLSLAVSHLAREDKYLSARENKTDTPSQVKQMVHNLQLDDGTNKSYIQSVSRPCP